MWDKFKLHLEDDCHKAWKWLSIQFSAAALALDGLQESIHQGWITLPDEFKQSLPTWLPRMIGAAVLCAIIGRLYKQKLS